MRASGCFGVILDAECWQYLMLHTCDRVVVEVVVSDLKAIRQRIRLNAETVILRSDLNLASRYFLNRLIGSAVAEFQFVSFRTTR